MKIYKKVMAILLCAGCMLLAACGKKAEPVAIRIASLKGPTTMGLVNLMQQSENGMASNEYTFSMETDASVVLGQMISGDEDIALLPANVAAVLYQKTGQGIKVLNINTLGVLYFVSGDESIQSAEDLRGKTIALTGKGTTPDYALQKLLAAAGITLEEVTLEYKAEATEVASLLANDSTIVGFLPQPFVTAALKQNDALSIRISADEAWKEFFGTELVTGVTVVRTEFLEAHEAAVREFLAEEKTSIEMALSDVDATAELIARYGIVEKAPVAKAALPYCNIAYRDGETMKSALSAYLTTLFEMDPAAVGGALPGDDFYYEGL